MYCYIKHDFSYQKIRRRKDEEKNYILQRDDHDDFLTFI